MSRKADIAALRAALAATAPTPRRRGPVLTFGVEEVDRHLPWGGLPPALHEICPKTESLPDEAAARVFAALPLVAAQGPILWIIRRRWMFAPALAEVGLTPGRVLYAEAGGEEMALAVAEEAVRHGGLGGVVVDSPRLSLVASRRLQLAAEAHGTPCFAIRPWRYGTPPAPGTAAATRWDVSIAPSTADNGLPRPSWSVALSRCRGGRPGAWLVELEREVGHAPTSLRLRLASELAGSSADAAARRRAA